ncbi:Tat pathway signal sequence domain protein [Streptomyces sp. CRN 30]|uniref:Tat pathway signal sequence domain protein n=1 Tax=Streptomyces sp. CRN 30 TaxID=3075613 RepID=UPI002A82B3FE|nr:Tat pathway signal sequence domain protein [Streptomyces sp. CRN 30]
MSGTGPVEPGADTHVRRAARPPRPFAGLTRHCGGHRRTALAAVVTLSAVAAGCYLYATRPQPRPAPPPPYPSQVVDFVYLTPVPSPRTAATGDFTFGVALSVRAGPPVTVTRIAQNSAGLSVISSPTAPFQTKSHSTRKITITLRITECEKAPRNAGFPFLDVTLRNTRAIQTHSFILGPRYAQHLSAALRDACGNDSP